MSSDDVLHERGPDHRGSDPQPSIPEINQAYVLFFENEENMLRARDAMQKFFFSRTGHYLWMWAVCQRNVPFVATVRSVRRCCEFPNVHRYMQCDCECRYYPNGYCYCEDDCYALLKDRNINGDIERSGILENRAAMCEVNHRFRGVPCMLMFSLKRVDFRRIFTTPVPGDRRRKPGSDGGNIGRCRRSGHQHRLMAGGDVDLRLVQPNYSLTHRGMEFSRVTDTVFLTDAMYLDPEADDLLLRIRDVAREWGCDQFPRAGRMFPEPPSFCLRCEGRCCSTWSSAVCSSP